MAGAPCIRGTRIPVATVGGMVAEGTTEQEVRTDFPPLTEDDGRDALRYASARAE
ncbi:MAG: DUF433 domain-containing protein [Microthrixaceae bacterium]|nr:DUF433 domain-containing protein [Microthrixaceae bacterium]